VIFGAVALALLALTVWALRRPRGEAAGPTPLHPRFLDESATPARGTPPGFGSPGVRRDADGTEYFGDYRLVAPLGRGGMASVYKAERRGEISALKRPLPAFLDEPEFLERFQREAEIGRTLHHPNIVRILERGTVDGVPYFTMELVPGETLQAHLQHAGALDPRLATEIVVQVAEALDYAHLKGVVHRDLKPSNVMVLEDGTAKVMDYGIARARRFDGLTVTGSFLGSPEYVAPEAIEGKGIDARSDLYSLGVIFYEALTGRRPFSAETPFGILRKHLTESPLPPSLLVPELPPELERIVLRLLDKQAEQRHAGAEELVLELRDFLNRAA
jgi:serine/threonine-protein kinase